MMTPDLFEYTDYKLFFADYFSKKKRVNPEYSYGMWARALGLKTTASLTMILNGDRHPGSKLKKQFSDFFLFDDELSTYFDDLVLLKKAENKDIALHLGILKKIKSRNSKKYNVLSEEVFNRINNWYYFAIREMIFLEDFKNDPTWISNKLIFEVEVTDIERAIDELIKLKIIKESSSGKLETCSDGLNTYDDMPSKSIQDFHKKMIGNATKALDEIGVEDRYISGLTIPVNSKNIDRLKAHIRKLEDEVLNMFADDEADSVYQVNIQLFPLTKLEKKKELQ